MPAFVSLLCICIVFVPMFFLQGVARFLFVPMAEAVVFAMICSFILSRTLVPTMAKYLLKPHGHDGGGRRVTQSAGALPAWLRGAVRARARGYRDCWRLRWAPRPLFVGLPGFVVRRSCWCRSSAATSSRRSIPARS